VPGFLLKRTAPIVLAAALAAGSACGSKTPTSPTSLTISSQPQSQTIASGETATLRVTATGAGQLRYQWYVGESGVTSTPISGATGAAYTTPAMTTTTSYWVRLSDALTSADSTTAIVAVHVPEPPSQGPPAPPAPPSPAPPSPPPPPGVGPSISAQPQSQSITAGQTATLSVAATGTSPLSYQWYAGSSGTTTSPVAGATASSFTTPALSTTASYWVRVSNAFGAANSATATITVTTPPPAGVAPTITLQPHSQTVNAGQTVTFVIGASGTEPMSYQWYAGPAGTTSSPIAGATAPVYSTPALTATTSYWIRVTNPYGAANSQAAIVTVTPGASTSSPFEDQVVALINERRAAGATCGATPHPPVGPLTMNDSLRTAARNHSLDMATQNYFSHTSLDGRTFDQRIRNAGYTGSFPLGENIAAGASTPQAVVDGWMGSPGHCANIMNGAFRATGVGYAFNPGATYRHYWTQTFGGS
jgi:uncharacterized protein YkwD/uncharacterized cupredoxin-like copper-binding protein